MNIFTDVTSKSAAMTVYGVILKFKSVKNLIKIVHDFLINKCVNAFFQSLTIYNSFCIGFYKVLILYNCG